MTAAAPKTTPQAPNSRWVQFRNNDSGNMTTLAVGLFFCMVMMGGVAVDLMRYEATRTSLQQTLDRSVLAAASLTQKKAPASVVQDYFAKAGLSQFLTAVKVKEGINFREVSADVKAETDPIFLHMIGHDSFQAAGHSQAEQRITNVDISLVLDISGSMLNNNRLTNLKTSASEFVDTVLSSDGDDKISIQIVPFSGQVNLGETLSARYNLTHDHKVAGVDCVDLPASTYATPGISTTIGLPVTAHADTYSTASQSSNYTTSGSTHNSDFRWCPPSTTNIIQLPTNSIATLKSHINGLTAVGATSINAGMKWGLALLDPGSRNMFTTLRLANKMPALMKDRPFDYTDDESLKVVILMTDGEHFAEERVKDAYKADNSTVWRRDSTTVNEYSVFHASKVNSSNATNLCKSRPFWVPHLNTWHSRPWNGTTPSSSTCYQTGQTYAGGGATNLKWPAIWSTFNVSWVAWHFYARPLGQSHSTWTAAIREQTPVSTMDAQLNSVCNLAKNNGVVVYGIAFEAPINGQTAIRNCATSTGHYFNASGLQIRTAFRTIANNISQLRLTQ